jgi:type III pantothenate kinase
LAFGETEMAVFFILGNTNVKVERAPGDSRSFRLGDGGALAEFLVASAGQQAVVASVNPPAEAAIAAACKKASLRAPLYAGRDFATGVELVVDSPAAVGIDRVLNVKAAFAHSGVACAAVDLGTAVSISVSDDAGRFVGGAILPGVGLALAALREKTALLPEVKPALPDTPLGRNTAAAMTSGCVFGTLGAIREIVARTSAVMGKELKVFLTGGDAVLIAPIAPPEWAVLAGLTLEGLRLAYEENG